jgi:hypothetical protein
LIRINSDRTEFISNFWGGWAVESYIRESFERRKQARRGENRLAKKKIRD